MADNNLRSAIINEVPLTTPSSSGYGGSATLSDAVLRTPHGNVRALGAPAPPLPQSPYQAQQSQFSGYNGGYGLGYGNTGYGFGGYNNYSMGGFGGYGGLGGYSSFGGYGGYGGYNRFGGAGNPNDPEQRFIQMAEASSRPAFQSIESLVSAIGNVASMLDSTFFALTSSFRAILGVAANFGRLRGVFAQFWSTFAIFRGLRWIYRKILYWLHISNLDPSSKAFKKAFAEAVNESSSQQAGGAPRLPRKGQSPWPVLAFLSFIFTAPYLIMKLLGTVTNTAQEEARNPSRWTAPIHTQAIYDFEARNQGELSLRAGAPLQVAPREIQQTLGLLNTGWAMASTDGVNSGIVPINYVKTPKQLREERANQKPQPDLMDLSANAFPAPPQPEQQTNFNFDETAATQQQQQECFGPPKINANTLDERFA